MNKWKNINTSKLRFTLSSNFDFESFCFSKMKCLKAFLAFVYIFSLKYFTFCSWKNFRKIRIFYVKVLFQQSITCKRSYLITKTAGL